MIEKYDSINICIKYIDYFKFLYKIACDVLTV